VVLDTNVIISAFCFPSGIPKQIFRAVINNHLLLFSVALMEELEAVLLRDKFSRYLSKEERIEAILDLDISVNYVAVSSVLDDIEDEKDNMVLALAVDGRADYLVTGNTRHFMLPAVQKRYPAITICTPRAFYDAVLQKPD
jgi:putative PIN family toxin of toxin-antitoxin system